MKKNIIVEKYTGKNETQAVYLWTFYIKLCLL